MPAGRVGVEGHEERVWTKEYPKHLSQNHCLLKFVVSVPYPDVTNNCEDLKIFWWWDW